MPRDAARPNLPFAHPVAPVAPIVATRRIDHNISVLPLQQAHELLQQLSGSSPDLAARITRYSEAYSAELAARRRAAPPINFDRWSKTCWKELNITHARKSGSKAYDSAGDVEDVIREAIKDTRAGCERSGNAATRLSAVATLRKIAKSVVTCDVGEIRKEVMNGAIPKELATAMDDVLGKIEMDENYGLREEDLFEKIRELDELYKPYCIRAFEDLCYHLDDVEEMLAIFDDEEFDRLERGVSGDEEEEEEE